MVPVSKLWPSQVCCSATGVCQGIQVELLQLVFQALKTGTDDVEHPFKFIKLSFTESRATKPPFVASELGL